MIRIHNPTYDIDVRMDDREAGSVIEFLLDTMEARVPADPAEAPAVRSTEIIPEPFGAGDRREFLHVSDADKAYFTGGEWRFISRLIWLLRSELICPNLRVNAWVKDDGTRGVELLTAERAAIISLPYGCDKKTILKAVMEKVALLYRKQHDEEKS